MLDVVLLSWTVLISEPDSSSACGKRETAKDAQWNLNNTQLHDLDSESLREKTHNSSSDILQS